MPRARVKFKPPTSVPGGPFKHSVEHPEDDLRILSAYPGEDGLVVVLEATTTDPEKIVHLFDDVPVEMFSEVIHRDERTVLLQFQLPFVPSAYRAVFASKNLPQFPYVLEDGWMVCELTTTHERLPGSRTNSNAADSPSSSTGFGSRPTPRTFSPIASIASSPELSRKGTTTRRGGVLSRSWPASWT
ncbi:hypothetical protein [Haladaptatus sp. DYF46]|uniref:hypothetical protein n=1 Tax=Haladaptatus sp. DYF46 TaxID=2886041 RepID=UPI001E3F7EB7